jgi:hypothetical protein
MSQHAQHGTDDILIAPAAMTNSETNTGYLDTVGSDYATIRVAFSSELNVSAVGPTITLAECDATSVASNFTTVTANRTGEDLTAERALTYHIDLRGRKRFLRLQIITATATTHEDITAGAVSTLYKEELPAAASGMADAAVVV